MSSSPPPQRFPSSGWTVIGGLVLLAPILVPLLVVLVLLVAFLVLMVVQAFGGGFAAGCAALAALIGIPSLVLLWLSNAMRVLGAGARQARRHPGALRLRRSPPPRLRKAE